MFRHRSLAPIMWCLACLGGVEVAECVKVEPARPPEKDAGFRVVPARVIFSKHLGFTEDGKPQLPHASLSISVAVCWPVGVFPISYSGVAIGEALTDQGENLAPQRRGPMPAFERPLHPQFFGRPDFGGPEPRRKFDVPLPLQSPQKQCAKITRLTGRITVKYAAKIQEVTVRPVGQWVGKRIAAPGIGDREVYVDDLREDSLKIRLKADAQKQLKEVKMFDASGAELRSGGYSGHGGSDYYTYEYRKSVPKDGSVVFHFYDDVRTQELPFVFTDLPLP